MDKRPQHRHDKETGVILLSGGIDSATTFYFAKKYGYRLFALIFDYQQRHRKEIECAKRIAYMNRTPYHVIRTDFAWTKSSLTQRDIKVPLNRDLHKKEIPLTYVAGRNIIFLSYAFSLAESIGAKKIFIGAHTQDYSGYPDCRPEFFQSFQSAANAGLKYKGIEIIAPLLNKNKKEIIKMGLDLRVPFEYTWSCYQGGRFPCQKCDSCRFRMQAFRELRMYDPLLKKREYKKGPRQEIKSKDAG
jgi:7-cyano-7-deazaguanine synthase